MLKEYRELHMIIATLIQKVDELSLENTELKNRLSKYETPKKSNNDSERAIRNIKVKQKVSGQFKSPNGAFIFAVLRSITDTVLKNKQNIICSLNTIANLQTD